MGWAADGPLADQFRGTGLKAGESAVVKEAIRQRRAVYVNYVDISRYPLAEKFHAQALMAAPLVVSNEAIGAVAFLHDSVPEFFNNNLAIKAAILAGQLGSLLGGDAANTDCACGPAAGRDPCGGSSSSAWKV